MINFISWAVSILAVSVCSFLRRSTISLAELSGALLSVSHYGRGGMLVTKFHTQTLCQLLVNVHHMTDLKSRHVIFTNQGFRQLWVYKT